MSPERWRRIERLLSDALAIPVAERPAFLDRACGDDTALRQEVESLIRSDEKAGPFLVQPILSASSERRDPKPQEPSTAGQLRDLLQRLGELQSEESGLAEPKALDESAEPESAGSDSSEPELSAGTVLAERYRVVTLVGRGGMGEIYRADDLRIGQPVALKLLPHARQHDESRLARFLDELKIARKISHPNVCRVHDLGEADGRLFLSMEFIDGEDLARLLRRIGRLSKNKAIEIGQQLCNGLTAAHTQGVLHRDLKPANLMIDGQGRARITDFGIAVLAQDASGHDAGFGTPAYMAPEQLAGREASVQSDLYALGLVLYELFTGQKPFQASSVAELVKLQQESEPVPPSRRIPGLDPAIEEVILHCLQRDPADRPTSAREVAAAWVVHDANRRWRPAPGVAIPYRRSWQLDKKLGEGGFGEVWLANHRKTRDLRVFKFCFQAERLRALQREITVFRLLKEELGERDDIVSILDWNFDEPPYFIEAEYTKGGSLVEWAEQQGGLDQVSLTTRLEIVSQIATALAAAHSVGVLHKDVKPGNVLITADTQGEVRARLNDFGVGGVTERHRLSAAGITILGFTEIEDGELSSASQGGTRLYTAPELLEAKPATLQADIYALGVILYQMIVGDFSRALAPGWKRNVDDPLLTEDIAAAVDGSPEKRLSDAQGLAERLLNLGTRRQENATRQREQAQAQQTQVALARSRRRRRWTALAMLVLATFATAMAIQSRRVAREAEVSQQVSDVLVDLLTVSDPERALGDKITARQILDRGAARITAELNAQPRIQARLMHIMGGVYHGLGLYDESIELLDKALEIRRGLYGDPHADLAATHNALAEVWVAIGDAEQGESHSREALAMRRNLFGAESVEVAESLDALAGALTEKGDFEPAERLYRESLAMRRHLLGAEQPAVATSLGHLASLLAIRGDLGGAEHLYREALDIRRRWLSEEHPDVAEAMSSLALVLFSRGNYAESETLYREVLAMRQRVLGEVHPGVAATQGDLARVLRAQGDFESAESLLRQALAMNRQLLGEEHPTVTSDLWNLALLLELKGDFVAAESLLRTVLARYREQFAEGHPAVANTMTSLASVLQAQGDHAEAEALYLKALSASRRLLGEDHPNVASGLSRLARLYRLRGDFKKAEPLYREALEISRAKLGEEHPSTAFTQLEIADLMLLERRFDEAHAVVLPAFETLRRQLPAKHWRLSVAESLLGACLVGLGRHEEAAAILKRSYANLTQRRGPQDSRTRDALERVAVLYENWGKPGEAESYRALLNNPETR